MRMSGLSLDKNPHWNGGRSVASNGYVKIKALSHPCADLNGYVYEHRIVMEKIIGRFLTKNEVVHHVDGDKTNNSPDNLVLFSSVAEHKTEHRVRQDLRPIGSENPIIECACGCGSRFLKYDEFNRPRSFAVGHVRKGTHAHENETVKCLCGCGETFLKYDKHGRERRFISGHNGRIGIGEKERDNDK